MSITENDLSELKNLLHVGGNAQPVPYSTALKTSHLEEAESELGLEAYAAYLILILASESAERTELTWLGISADQRSKALEHMKSLHDQWQSLGCRRVISAGLSAEERTVQFEEYKVADYAAQLYSLTQGEGIGDWTVASPDARNAARVESWLARKEWAADELQSYAEAFGSQETADAEQVASQVT